MEHDTTPSSQPAGTNPGPLRHTHLAGLDGLRGGAVLLVLMFHLWPNLLPGGFVGVTVFFALSGYLITTLLLRELAGSGTVALKAFYTRRVRRLLPASLLTLAAVGVTWNLTGWMTATTVREMVAATLNVANWQRVVDGQAYGTGTELSPVLHFWSLAIEEQVYLILPLIVLAARTRARIAATLAALFAGSVLYTFVVAGQATVVYYSTFTRVAELLAGALVAVVTFGTTGPKTTAGRRTVATLAATGTATLVIVAATTSLSNDWYYRGGLTALGMLAAVTVWAVTCAHGVARRLDVPALQWVGHRSYGLYLFHWPLLVTFTNAGVTSNLVPYITLVATFTAAAWSHRFIEQPLRTGRPTGLRFAALMVGFAAIVPVSAVGASETRTDFEAALTQFDSLTSTNAGLVDTLTEPATTDGLVPAQRTTTETPPASGPTTAPQPSTPDTASPGTTTLAPTPVATPATTAPATTAPSTTAPATTAPATTAPQRPVRVGFFGDSKVLTLGLGLDYRGPDIITGTSLANIGCPLGRNIRYRDSRHQATLNTKPECDWTTRFDNSAPDPVDVAVVWFGTWDIRETKRPGTDTWTDLTDPAQQRWLFDEMRTYTGKLAAHTGATRILWLTLPVAPDYPHAERYDAYNMLLHQLAAERTDVDVVDIAALIANSGDGARLLPDGIHTTFDLEGGPNSAAEIGDRWLNAIILDTHRT